MMPWKKAGYLEVTGGLFNLQTAGLAVYVSLQAILAKGIHA